MLERTFAKAYGAYLKAKMKMVHMMQEEDGMETLEAVIMVAVAVILVGFIVNFLTRNGFQDSSGADVGLIQYLFDKIKTMVEGALNP